MAEPTSHIPRMMKVRGSPEFIEDTIRYLKTNWQKDLALAVGVVEKTYADLEECRAWEIFPPEEPFGSEDALLRKTLGITLEEFRVRIGKAKRDQRTILAAQQNPEPIPPHGGHREGAGRRTEELMEASSTEAPSKNQVYNFDNCKLDSPGKGGNRISYRIRQLRRDHPAIAARLDAGEFKSVAAAERASRGEEPNPPRRQAPLVEQFKRLWSKATEQDRDEIRAFIEACME